MKMKGQRALMFGKHSTLHLAGKHQTCGTKIGVGPMVKDKRGRLMGVTNERPTNTIDIFNHYDGPLFDSIVNSDLDSVAGQKRELQTRWLRKGHLPLRRGLNQECTRRRGVWSEVTFATMKRHEKIHYRENVCSSKTTNLSDHFLSTCFDFSNFVPKNINRLKTLRSP